MRIFVPLMLFSFAWGLPLSSVAQDKIRVLIIDGLNPYHEWQVTSPLMKQILEGSGQFSVDIATVPIPAGFKPNLSGPNPRIEGMEFRPPFADYDAVIGNYIGPRWPEETERAFVEFVESGHGYVAVHAADNAFPDWPEYSLMCGVGGWYGRNEKSGPRLYLKESGEVVRDTTPGAAGHHGPQHEFLIRVVDTGHPITRGLPEVWRHAKDELYDTLRGPAQNVRILAAAYSDPKFDGTGKHEPMMMVIPYGKGRVFHTVLGHADYSMKCVGFQTTLLRGTEWAATGEVTIPVPEEFPGPDGPRAVE